MPENQRVIVGSLGFFDLIFISSGIVLLSAMKVNSAAVMLVNVTISDTIALCLLVLFSCILIPPGYCGRNGVVQEEYTILWVMKGLRWEWK